MTTVTVSYNVTSHALALPRHWGPVDQANMGLVDLVHHHGGQDWEEGRERSKREIKEDRAAYGCLIMLVVVTTSAVNTATK